MRWCCDALGTHKTPPCVIQIHVPMDASYEVEKDHVHDMGSVHLRCRSSDLRSQPINVNLPRTHKAVYEEAPPILHSSNTFTFVSNAQSCYNLMVSSPAALVIHSPLWLFMRLLRNTQPRCTTLMQAPALEKASGTPSRILVQISRKSALTSQGVNMRSS